MKLKVHVKNEDLNRCEQKKEGKGQRFRSGGRSRSLGMFPLSQTDYRDVAF